MGGMKKIVAYDTTPVRDCDGRGIGGAHKKRPAGGSGPNEPCRFSVYNGAGRGAAYGVWCVETGPPHLPAITPIGCVYRRCGQYMDHI